MLNVQAVVIKLLLTCADKDLALTCFDKIRPHFFSSAYSTLHKAMAEYYSEVGSMPNLDELAIRFSRNQNIQQALVALSHMDTLDVDMDMAVDALRDEYAQHEALDMIKRDLLSDIVTLSAEDIVDRLNALPLLLEEKVESTGSIYTAKDIAVFTDDEETDMEMIYTGFSNEFDNKFGGLGRQEFILLGGKTGSGKSVCCSNLQVSQWLMGNVAPYYTIEMSAKEVMMRNLSILAGVDAMKAKQNRLEGDDIKRLALARAKMFHGGAEAFKNYTQNKNLLKSADFARLDDELRRNHEEIHPMIIIDDNNLKVSTIDVSLSKFSARYGKKLTMGIVDYVNETRLDSKGDPYDWVYQLELARAFKNLARKHDCAIVSPYQLNDNGEARFSKALLIPVDIAFTLSTGDNNAGYINFKSSKARSLPNVDFNVGIDWTSLKTSPEELSESDVIRMEEEALAQSSSQDAQADNKGGEENDLY